MSFQTISVEYTANCSDDDEDETQLPIDNDYDSGYTCYLCSTSYEKGRTGLTLNSIVVVH